MKVALGCDHRGDPVSRFLLSLLPTLGHEVKDFGHHGASLVDYPDVALPVALAVACSEFGAGILVCSDGVGMCIAANKVHKVRAAVVHDGFSARVVREHHDCNLMCLAADLVSGINIGEAVNVFLSAQFSGGPHARRVDKLMQIEQRHEPYLAERPLSGSRRGDIP